MNKYQMKSTMKTLMTKQRYRTTWKGSI